MLAQGEQKMTDSFLEQEELARLRAELTDFVIEEATLRLASDPKFRDSVETALATRLAEMVRQHLDQLSSSGIRPDGGLDVVNSQRQPQPGPRHSSLAYLWLGTSFLFGIIVASAAWFLLQPQLSGNKRIAPLSVPAVHRVN